MRLKTEEKINDKKGSFMEVINNANKYKPYHKKDSII